MSLLRSSALRQAFALALMLVLILTGVGRGFAATSDIASAAYGLPGVAFHICHTGDGGESVPTEPSRHDCCDACALLAPLMAAEAPVLNGPASVTHYVAHAQAMAWVQTAARLRSPRQSQGPPAA